MLSFYFEFYGKVFVAPLATETPSSIKYNTFILLSFGFYSVLHKDKTIRNEVCTNDFFPLRSENWKVWPWLTVS